MSENVRDAYETGLEQGAPSKEVLDGIAFLFDIIESEVGDRMGYLDDSQQAQVAVVREWLKAERAKL